MAGEWIDTTLGEVLTLQRGFDLPETERKPGPYPVIASTGPVGSHDEAMVHGPGVVIGRSGSLGGGQFIMRDFWPLNTTLWVKDFKGNDRRFCYYLLKSLDLAHFNAGSGVPTLNRNHIHPLPVTVPTDAAEQRAIAHILGTLDDKIELNRRMSETLEAIARALFESWFVRFDPVRRNMARAGRGQPSPPAPLPVGEGRTATTAHPSPTGRRVGDEGVVESTAFDHLFPDSFVDSELGEIPKGWEVGSLDEEFNLTMGQSPPGETYNEVGDGFPFYQGRADFGFRFPSRSVYCTAPTRFAKKDDTLVSVRAPVGDINMAAEDCAIGRGVAAIRHKTGSRSYSYQLMKSIKDVFDRFDDEGTVFGSISKKDFQRIPCVKPPHELVLAYEVRVAALDDRIEVNEHESRTLAALRDTLLPKIIRGEIRVKDAERFLKEREL